MALHNLEINNQYPVKHVALDYFNFVFTKNAKNMSVISEFQVEGMSCNGCISRIKEHLEVYEGVASVDVQLESPQVTIESNKRISKSELQNTLSLAGDYKISTVVKEEEVKPQALPIKSIGTYKPLILIISFLALVVSFTQFTNDHFSISNWMRHFMAGFFITFSFFKVLNLHGFTNSFRMYDIVASKWKNWGYVYPFLELVLGMMYLTNTSMFITNILAIMVLGVGSIGVIKSNLNKDQIKCACLGDVFDLPMSTVTIVENVSMILMASMMIWMIK